MICVDDSVSTNETIISTTQNTCGSKIIAKFGVISILSTFCLCLNQAL